jgi:hypothetical protein
MAKLLTSENNLMIVRLKKVSDCLTKLTARQVTELAE